MQLIILSFGMSCELVGAKGLVFSEMGSVFLGCGLMGSG